MSKTAAPRDQTETRSPERDALAEAIAARDEADREEAALARARQRAAQDLFGQRRLVEAAELALVEARERDKAESVASFVSGEPNAAPSGIPEAEAALRRAKEKLAEIEAIAADLAGRGREPGFSVPSKQVEDAIKAVLKADPTVRRLANDFAAARAAYLQYHSTLRWLNAHGYVPDDLSRAAPSPSETFFVPPDPLWVETVEALRHSHDSPLPG